MQLPSIRSLTPFWFFVLFYRFGAGLHYALLSALGIRVLPVWEVGLLMGGGALIQMLCDVPAGYLLDRFGYTRLLGLSTASFVLAATVLLTGLTPFTYVCTLAFATLGWLFYGPGANAYVLASAPKVAAGKYLGFFNAVASAGIVLSSVTLAFVINWNTWAIGLLLGGLLITALIAIRATPSPAQSVHAERKVHRHTYYVRRHFVWDLFKKIRALNPASTLLMLQGFSGSLLYAAIWFVIPLVIAGGEYRGLWGISLSVFDLAIVVLGSYLGKLADKSDHKRMVFYGLLIFAVAGTVLGFNLNVWFLLLGFLATAGDEMSSVSLWAWLDHLDKGHGDEGLINGAVMFFQDLAWTVGPIMAGFLYAQVGPAWTITGAALPIFVVWGISAVFLGALPKSLWPTARAWAREVPVRLRHKN